METVPVVVVVAAVVVVPTPVPVSSSPPPAAAAALLSLLDLNLFFGRCLLQLIQNSTGGGGFRVPDLAECNTGTGNC